jgi:benzoyl-CoA reductase/2-hydroxyglutaryl-CoA dehydratase subunit BcrC/BadD/HgdB
MTDKYVWLFSNADGKDKAKFGGKGANLAEMTSLGLPIPQGFIVTTEACTKYYEDGKIINREIEDEIYTRLYELEDLTGKKITLDNLKKALDIVNKKRKALQRLSQLRSIDPVPISGLDALLVNQISFYDDPIRFTQKVNELCDELEERVKRGKGVFPKGTTRILIAGSPFAIPNWKLHSIIENSGAVVVGEESCVGSRNYRELTDENFSTIEEGIEKIASRYLTIDCACFTPNQERLDNIVELKKTLKADGVIHYSLQFCTPYLMEAFKIEKLIDFPYMRIETDYSMEDFGQIKTRVEAFIETLK